MKTLTTKHIRGRRSLLPLARAIRLGILASGWLAQAQAITVDSELVLLVDVTNSGLSATEFNQVMDGYATAFTSSEIMDSIQSGAYGRIAVSMMFFGDSSTQVVGVPWMMIGNSTQAEQFADLVRTVSRPFSVASPDVGSALTVATFSFGTETGGTANGYESAVQIIDVASGKVPKSGTEAAAAASSAAALASGVDLINSLALGSKAKASAVDSFYDANVIGSTIAGVSASSGTSAIDASLAATMSSYMTETAKTGAIASATAVPEPSSLYGLIPATLLLLRRRRP
jgi:hypothetical protein